MAFSWHHVNRALRQRRFVRHADEAGQLRDRHLDATELRQQAKADLNQLAAVRRPCANSLVPATAQPNTSRSNSRPVSRYPTPTQSLSVCAPGMSAVAKFRAKIPLNGVRADVKQPDPLPKG